MEIFDFIGKDNNDLISRMNAKDRKELLSLLKEYSFALRSSLALSKNATFGLEFEFSTEKPDIIKSKLNYAYNVWTLNKMRKGMPYQPLGTRNWEFKNETSFRTSDQLYGSEISTPILTDTTDTWDEVKKVCAIIDENGGTIGDKTAGHVHVGTQILGNSQENWLNFFRLYTLYEDAIYRFGYGEYESHRSALYTYANPIAMHYYEKLKALDSEIYPPSMRKIFDSMKTETKRKGLGFYKVSQGGTSFEENRTIEFRMPNASLNPAIWQNNVNFFVHFLQRATEGLDTELINSKIRAKLKDLGRLQSYCRIDVDEALELADLIFDNNLDKINFLRQYIKNFKESRDFVKSKSFTK